MNFFFCERQSLHGHEMGKLKTPSTNNSTLVTMLEAESLPSFDKTALSALTEKIEKGLGKDKSRSHTGEIASRNHTHDSKRSQTIDADAKTSTKARPSVKGRGTKRDALGNMKMGGNHSKPKNQKPRREQDTGAALLQEILALGGTEDDFDLSTIGGPASVPPVSPTRWEREGFIPIRL